LLENHPVGSRHSFGSRHFFDLALPDDFDALFEEQEIVMNYEAARGLAPAASSRPSSRTSTCC